MHNCDICGKRECRVAFNMLGYDMIKHDKMIDKNLFICYACLCEFFSSILRRIEKERPCKHSKNKTGAVIPSIPWARRIKMGKISNNELIDIHIWLKHIKSLKDFKEKK